MRDFFGSMTGRVFVTLLLGIFLSAALTQWLADAERQRVIEGFRDQHALERAEQLIMATEVVPASARMAYLKVANRPGMRLEEINRELPRAPEQTEFAAALAQHLGPGYKLDSIAARPAACDVPRTQSSMFGPTQAQWRGACESIDVRLRDGEMLRLSVLPPR
ncbi:MAG: two-component sensor histidine kinase, partial [Massilia sp.]|nr:two-component sensor histidine kinase [Massilia sp.]